MKKTAQATAIAFLVMAVILGYGHLPVAQAQNIRVFVDGSQVFFSDQQPFEGSGRVYVPARAPMEAIGVTVSWDDAYQTMTLVNGNNQAVFTVSESFYYVNGVAHAMDVCPMLVNNRVVLPIRYASEAFGASVSWDEPGQSVIISTNNSSSEPVFNSYSSENFDNQRVVALLNDLLRSYTPSFDQTSLDDRTMIYVCVTNVGSGDYAAYPNDGTHLGNCFTPQSVIDRNAYRFFNKGIVQNQTITAQGITWVYTGSGYRWGGYGYDIWCFTNALNSVSYVNGTYEVAFDVYEDQTVADQGTPYKGQGRALIGVRDDAAQPYYVLEYEVPN